MKLSATSVFSLITLLTSVVSSATAQKHKNIDVEVSFHSGPSKMTDYQKMSVVQSCLINSFNEAQNHFGGRWQLDEAFYVSNETLDPTEVALRASSECQGQSCCPGCVVSFQAIVGVGSKCQGQSCCPGCLPSFVEHEDKHYHSPETYIKNIASNMTATKLESLAAHRAWEEYLCACMDERHVGTGVSGCTIYSYTEDF